MLTVEEALKSILERASPLGTETVSLREARGRILAEDIVADISVPPFANSAVDGYAVRAEDTVDASPDSPVLLQALADIHAGTVSQEVVTAGTAARIMTGAPAPEGANAIVMVEDTRQRAPGTVEIYEAARLGQHIRPAGEDIKQGDRVIVPGLRLRSMEIGMLATLGYDKVAVVRRPRVAVVSTGDEIVEIIPGEVPPPGKIRNSNQYALAALVEEFGGIVGPLLHLPDALDATVSALRDLTSGADAVDVIVTAGGVSVGDRDFVKPALEALGTLALWKIAMRPGKPLAFGWVGNTLFFGLPGNPVSAYVTFLLFVRPLLARLAGRAENDLALPEVEATLTADIDHTPGRREYVRAITTPSGGTFITRPTGAQGSNLIHSLTQANSLLIVPEASEGEQAGSRVRVLLLP